MNKNNDLKLSLVYVTFTILVIIHLERDLFIIEFTAEVYFSFHQTLFYSVSNYLKMNHQIDDAMVIHINVFSVKQILYFYL